MNLIVDTHLHFYPCYDLGLAMDELDEHLGRLLMGTTKVACLAERHDCHYMEGLRNGSLTIDPAIQIRCPADDPSAILQGPDCVPVFLLAGRQVVTRERIEILSLTSDTAIPDGLPAIATVERILQADAVPVISWAPGKWFFERGTVVAGLMERFAPGQILLGDTTLRPTIWPEPDLVRRGKERGFAVLAGSDPLPFAGEECRMGTYGTYMDIPFDHEKPAASLRAALRSPDTHCVNTGRRGGLFEVLRRLRGNARAKH